MIKITKKMLDDAGFNTIIINSPVILGRESLEAIEMGTVLGVTFEDVIERVKSLIKPNDVIYIFEDFELLDSYSKDKKYNYVLRFTHESISDTPIILKAMTYSCVKLQDFLNMWGEEEVKNRIYKDFKLLCNN